jgi:glycosyltransferase involved in cell wall biosynthesis
MAGAGVYTYQLVRALAGAVGGERLTVFARPGIFDGLDGLDLVPVEPSGRAGRLFWEQTSLPLLLRKRGIDVLHSPHHHTPLAAGLAGAKQVVTVHDVTFLILRDRYPAARRLYMEAVTRAAVRVAEAIITPSLAVRRDVIRRLRVPERRVVAIPEAAGPQFAPVVGEALLRGVRERYHLDGPYVLSVGSLEPGKNRATLLRALALLRASGTDCTLAIAGQPAWRYEGDDALIDRLGLRERVRFLGYVPDEDLPALYSAASVFAFPSLYEGFGLPVLEAMACGAPVVTSNGSALAEVAGGAALLIDPRDADALADAIVRLLTDDSLHEELRARGLARAAEFSWERTARETLAIYHAVAGS